MRPDNVGAQLEACVPRLRRYARALTGERAAADDLVQDTLERAWGRLPSWSGAGELRAWVFSIMHNTFIDQRRRPGLSMVGIDDEDGAMSVPTRATQADALELRDLDAALAQLPAEQRAVLLLVGLEQMSYAEVAATLDIPMGTVMSRLSRGRERLRAILEGRPHSPNLKAVK